nr:class I SAM-dependent methyltransferase [Aliiglaciecola lipolytica]
MELGIAEGVFSAEMMKSKKFMRYFGIDRYSDHHDVKEYLAVLKKIMIPHQNFTLIRSTFDEGVDLFPDEYFDFIYVDGYAHTGENAGKTIEKWYPKLKVGGIMAGDDYHDDWPLVKLVVNHVVEQLGVELNVTENTSKERYCMYPSWAFLKPNLGNVFIDEEIVLICTQEENKNVRKDLKKLKEWSQKSNGGTSDS